jgi:hypothetical protein
MVEAGQTVPEVAAIKGNITVNGKVKGDAVAIFGSVTVRGHVTGDAVALLGNVKLEPGAQVNGDAVAVLGHVEKGEGAEVGGDTVSLGPSFPTLVNPSLVNPYGIPWLFLFTITIAATLLRVILVAVVIALFPVHSERMARTVIAQPGRSALWGFAFVLMALFVFPLLLISCIGIPLIPVAVLLVLVVKLFGRVAIGITLGRRLGKAVNRPVTSAVWAAVIGILVMGLISLIPIVGWLVVFVLQLIGVGAALLTKLGSREMPPESQQE